MCFNCLSVFFNFHSKRPNTVLTILADMARGVIMSPHHQICRPSDNKDYNVNNDVDDDDVSRF